VSVWRELRRINPEQVEDALREAAMAADAGDWGSFVLVMGGPKASRKEHALKAVHAWSDVAVERIRQPPGEHPAQVPVHDGDQVEKAPGHFNFLSEMKSLSISLCSSRSMPVKWHDR
jgi:hypothetical protein